MLHSKFYIEGYIQLPNAFSFERNECHCLYTAVVVCVPHVVGFIPKLVLDNCRGGFINDSCWELMRTFKVCYNATEQSSRLLEDRNHEQHQKSRDVSWTGLTTSS